MLPEYKIISLTLLFLMFFQVKVFGEITTFTNYISSSTQRDPNVPNVTVIYVHSWNTRSQDKAITLKSSLLRNRKDVLNVIIADWSTFSQSPDYYNVAKRYTPRVAEDIEGNIKGLVEQKGVQPSNIECIGHGLGAHICGQVGKLWNRNYRQKFGNLGAITGLDPTGPYFRDHPAQGLAKNDATVVKVFHTDKRFGIYSDIGDIDFYPAHDPEIVECGKKRFLKRNQCLHNAVIDIFLRSIMEGNTFSTISENSTQNGTKNGKIPMSILTLDVSPSMQNFGRIQNMVAASKRLVHSLPLGYFIGIVIFGGEAQISLPPTNITDDTISRQFIISKLPTAQTEVANTSIGAGISRAFDLAETYLVSDDYCPDLILVTDGEENKAPFIRDIHPKLKNICMKIHTIALGDDADVELEALSELTKGQAYFASDVNSLDKLTQSLVAASTVQFSFETVPIHLPPKYLTLDSSASFELDEGIGNQTTFVVSTPNPEKVNAQLIAPNGQTFGINNYTVETDLHQLLFKLLEVQAGNWTIKLNSGTGSPAKRRKRRLAEIDSMQNRQNATIFVTSYPSNESTVEPIRLEAFLSSRILNYSKKRPLKVEAHLYKGYSPIINARVKAEISSSDGSVLVLELFDNGAGADEEKNDGVYSRFVSNEFARGKRYQVGVTATSALDGSTKIRSGDGDPFKLNAEDMSVLAYNFERQANAGSFRVDTESSYKPMPPNAVTDLQVISVDESKRWCTLMWSAAGRELDSGIADFIQLKAFTDFRNESNGFEFGQEELVVGSFEPLPIGSVQEVTVQVPETLWEESKNGTSSELHLYFTVRSGTNETGLSTVSNIAPAEFAIPLVHFDNYFLYLCIFIPILLLLIFVGIIIFLILKHRMAHFNVKTRL